MQVLSWKSGIAALCVLSTLPTAIANGSDGHTSEIGTVQQVYDGRLTPDIQANTFRNIDRLFPTRTVNRGVSVTPLKASPKPLPDVKFQSSGKTVDLSTTYRSTGWPVSSF